MSSTDTTSTTSSASALLSTLIPVAALAAAFFILFLIFRSKYHRVYAPRTHLGTLRDNERTTALPQGRFSWVKPFRGMHDDYLINHSSLDGYLWVRYFKMLTLICFVGCLFLWPVLFPVNATAHGGQKQLDILGFSNIPKSGKNRYYAHVFCAWIYFSFIMFIITRETMYYINLRHAYLLSPLNAEHISSRVVLFTFVPGEYLKLEKIRELFGGTMTRAWFAENCKTLRETVDKRDKVALKLEAAEIKLSTNANKKRLKAEKKAKKGKGATATPAPASAQASADVETGTLQSQWLDKKDRPTHRLPLAKLPIGKKVDTIDWARAELGTLVPEVERSQATFRKHDAKLESAVFVEFVTQQAAEHAYRSMNPKKSPHMTPRAISVAPSQVVWPNLGMSKSQRRIRVILTSTFLAVLILYWAIPVAIVGAISNINALTDKVHFLKFINHIPKAILGVVTGLLPAVLLSVLMALVPIICRKMAKISGEVTLPDVELKCQNWYFAFQVVDVFIITTFASGAAAVVTQIINKPSSATTLLAQNLPKASNFYISYIIVQGLGIAAGNLLNIGGLAGFLVLGKFLDKTPRKMFKRYITLAGLGWGSLYPQFGCLAVIAFAYAIIAPLVLGFATIGFLLIYIAARYNVFYVMTNNVDTKGRAYAKALQQLFVGLYVAEICLLGLFAINTAPGPIVLMAVFLGITIIYHAIMRHALRPLTLYLPESMESHHQNSLFNTGSHKQYDSSKAGLPPSEEPVAESNKGPNRKASLFARIFNPSKFKSHGKVRTMYPPGVTAESAPPAYEEFEAETAYFDPAITSYKPKLWIVRDAMGISRREVAESSKVVDISDEFAWFDEKGKVQWNADRMTEIPIWEKRIDY